MEKVVRDLGAVIAHCRDKLGYARVVLGGWSGGGSLAAFYQGQAEAPIARRVAAPLPAPLSGYSLAREDVVLPPADGVMIMAAHSSRARILTEWLDPSIYLLRRGDHPAEEAKLRHLDLCVAVSGRRRGRCWLGLCVTTRLRGDAGTLEMVPRPPTALPSCASSAPHRWRVHGASQPG